MNRPCPQCGYPTLTTVLDVPYCRGWGWAGNVTVERRAIA
jgi:hypothetical protein